MESLKESLNNAQTAKAYLQVIEGIDAASPKSLIRHCREIGLINEEQTDTIITMADVRNLPVHTDAEALARKWKSEFVPMMDCYSFGMIRR